MKENKDTKKGQDIPTQRLKDIIKMFILLKAICRLNASSTEKSMAFFTELEQPKICTESQKN